MYSLRVLFILILISSIPVIAVYVWFRLAKYQFSLYRFLFALLAGAAAFFPALVLQDTLTFSSFTEGRAALFFHVFVRIALTEELSRLLMLFIFLRVIGRVSPGENPDQPLSYNTVKRGTAIGLVAGLGFAILENAAYAASDTGALFLRVFTAAPLHGACGSRIGAAAVMFRSHKLQAIFRIVTATAIHGVYNLMVGLRGFPAIAAVLIAVSALITAITTIRGGWSSDENSQYGS
jgi:RsiW-degrading membrane proteinase PrsW (M82 family)